MNETSRRGRPHIALIAAVARHGAIGRDNGLLWHEAADQRHFRDTTRGSPVVMGRRTWDSLPPRFRPLPERRNVVLSRNPHWAAPGAERVGSWPEALDLLHEAEKVYVIGGAQLYALALPDADELVLTEIDAELQGDSFFPPWDRAAFALCSRQDQTPVSGPAFAFVNYRRKA